MEKEDLEKIKNYLENLEDPNPPREILKYDTSNMYFSRDRDDIYGEDFYGFTVYAIIPHKK